MLAPSDQPVLAALGEVGHDLLRRLGMDVDFRVSDWGTLVQRRASREPPERGGWNMFHTTWNGLDGINPGVMTYLRANGQNAWFGWPDVPRLEELRLSWFDAPDLAAQKRIAADDPARGAGERALPADRPVFRLHRLPADHHRADLGGVRLLGRAAGLINAELSQTFVSVYHRFRHDPHPDRGGAAAATHPVAIVQIETLDGNGLSLFFPTREAAEIAFRQVRTGSNVQHCALLTHLREGVYASGASFCRP